VAQHCPECGFVNADGANYCQKCGSYLGSGQSENQSESSTATYRVNETGELVPVDVERWSPTRAPRSSSGRVAAAWGRASRSGASV